MRNKDFVRRGSKVQCMWKASLFCILMMQCVCTLVIATTLGVFVCLCRQCLGTCPYYYTSGMVLFTLQFRTVPCCAGMV